MNTTSGPASEEPTPRGTPFEELKAASARWLSQFNSAFALMSVIPLLIAFYLITARLFSLSILEGLNGVYFLIAIVVALLGLLAGRRVIKRIIERLLNVNRRLERFQAMQSEFVSDVAHEFRTPLGIMKGAVDNLMDGLYGDLSPEQKGAVAIIDRDTARLNRIVRDLLDMGQIEVGRLRLVEGELVLQEVLREVTQSCRELSKGRSLDLKLDVPETPIRVRGDRDRVTQAFLNLITNAIKFTEQGRVHVRLTHNGDASQVEVADTGQGIAAEDLDRIFNKFERAGDGKQEGSGLGLPIAKAIVELHRGRIWVESEVGQGTRFFVRLPVPPPKSSVEGPAARQARTGPEPRRSS